MTTIMPVIKKYAKYLWRLVPVALVILFIIFRKMFTGGKTDPNLTQGTQELSQYIAEVGAKMTEAHQTAVVETVVAKTQSDGVKKNLQDVSAIDDSVERRKRLLDLYAQVQTQGKS